VEKRKLDFGKAEFFHSLIKIPMGRAVNRRVFYYLFSRATCDFAKRKPQVQATTH
jgi:hypothetical protein